MGTKHGRPLAAHGVDLPEYFDPHYNCWMEVLRFDSRQLNPRYEARAQAIRRSLLGVPVVCASSGYRGLQEWLRAPENLVVHPAKAGMQVA